MEMRMARLKEEMKNRELDYMLITDKTNRRYLSGFTGSNGLLLIGLSQAYLIIDGRYTEQAEQQTKNINILVTSTMKNQWQYVAELVGDASSVGFEAETIAYQSVLALKERVGVKQLVETHQLIEGFRMIKTEEELTCLKQAAKLADQTFSYITTIIKPGMTELDVANEIDYYSKRIGSEGPAFETIVASGTRTALPHAHASKKIIQGNELIMIDFGCIVNGYYSDMTRTFALGEVDSAIKETYGKVLAAQQEAIKSATVGKKLKELDALARDLLAEEQLARYFSHGLGHGIGLSCHEYPAVNSLSEVVLASGMVFTVEPGVYLSGEFGIRIEDDVSIDAEGHATCLTQTKKEWLVI